jgi:hypothetical protein
MRENWRVRTRVEAEGEAPASAKIKLQNRSRKGAKLRINARGLVAEESLELVILDPDTGEELVTKECQANARGRLRIRARSRDGDALFLGEDNASGLAGARFELRNGSGHVVLEGEIPAP